MKDDFMRELNECDKMPIRHKKESRIWKIHCNHCAYHYATYFVPPIDHREGDDGQLDYCSAYCATAMESPEDLRYFKKPKWVKL